MSHQQHLHSSTPGNDNHISADEVAALVGIPHLTDKQRAIIAAPLESTLIMAGAGAGKTTTMALRMCYLIINDIVASPHILGLTFSRKACYEIEHKLQNFLSHLKKNRNFNDNRLNRSLPTIKTYHSYALDIIKTYGLLAGIDPETRIIDDAQQWQWIHQYIYQHGTEIYQQLHQKLAETNNFYYRTLDELTSDIISLKSDMEEHTTTSEKLAQFTRTYLHKAQQWKKTATKLPPKTIQADIDKHFDSLEYRMILAELIPTITEYLIDNHVMDYDLAVSKANYLAQKFPFIGQQERSKYPTIFLDEYQDTGEAQRNLLTVLFAISGHNTSPCTVQAVGDPLQTIYGWRSASAMNLPRFPSDFSTGTQQAQQRNLTQSWRNPVAVLTLANAIADKLRTQRIYVPQLESYPQAPIGHVTIATLPSQMEESQWIAQHISALKNDNPATTIAVLLRKNTDATPIASALAHHNISYHIANNTGLLSHPHIQEIRAWLALINGTNDEHSDENFLLLAAGPRWNIGAHDLAVLAQHRKTLSNTHAHPHNQPRATEASDSSGTTETTVTSVVSGISSTTAISGTTGTTEPTGTTKTAEPAETTETTETTGPTETTEPTEEKLRTEIEHKIRDSLNDTHITLPTIVLDFDLNECELSATGRKRLQEFAQSTKYARELLNFSPERMLDYVIEQQGSQNYAYYMGQYTPDTPTPLDTFRDIYRQYHQHHSPYLGDFLRYCQLALIYDKGLTQEPTVVDPTTVTIMTIHAAKGLEFDHVFIAGITETTFPARFRGLNWTTTPGKLPAPLRKDIDDIPEHYDELSHIIDAYPTITIPPQEWENFSQDFLQHKEHIKIHEASEERRLLYVACTRAKHTLYITGYTKNDPTKKSEFITEIEHLIPQLCKNPQLAHAYTIYSPEQQHLIPSEVADPAPSAKTKTSQNFDLTIKTHEITTLTTNPTIQWPKDINNKLPTSQIDGGKKILELLTSQENHILQPPSAYSEPEQVLIEQIRQETKNTTNNNQPATPIPHPISVSQLISENHPTPKTKFTSETGETWLNKAESAALGTLHHQWVQQQYLEGLELIELHELPGSADIYIATHQHNARLTEWKKNHQNSRWAAMEPVAIEQFFTLLYRGKHIIGRIDAVFYHNNQYIIVDWKTNKEIPTQSAITPLYKQLALYRLAWSTLKNIPAESIKAILYFVNVNQEIELNYTDDAQYLQELFS